MTALKPKPRRPRAHHRELPDGPRFERVAERDGFARVRYLGQERRGPLSAEASLAQSVKLAMDELAEVYEALMRADAQWRHLSDWHRVLARRELLGTVAGKLGLARRLVDEVPTP